jgi:hypothetical protein
LSVSSCSSLTAAKSKRGGRFRQVAKQNPATQSTETTNHSRKNPRAIRNAIDAPPTRDGNRPDLAMIAFDADGRYYDWIFHAFSFGAARLSPKK